MARERHNTYDIIAPRQISKFSLKYRAANSKLKEIMEPGIFLSSYETQDFKKTVNLAGIINAPVISFTTKTGKVMNRVGVILPDRSQIILEIWSKQEKSTPKFARNWQVLQLIIIFNVSFGGHTRLNGKLYKIFRLNCNWEHKFGRFIWLSTDSEKFWYKPISERDLLINPVRLIRESWPRRVPFGSGTLRISKGSVISPDWLAQYPSWHTSYFENFKFADFIDLHQVVKRGVFGFINLLTGKAMHNSLNFKRSVYFCVI